MSVSTSVPTMTGRGPDAEKLLGDLPKKSISKVPFCHKKQQHFPIMSLYRIIKMNHLWFIGNRLGLIKNI